MKQVIPIAAMLAAFLLWQPAAWSDSEKVLDYTFEDGVSIKVHYTDTVLAMHGETRYFAQEVLNAAVSAYQTITDFQGFDADGFSFAKPDKRYAYDPDRAIDVYLGHPEDPETARLYGVSAEIFKDAPCFDTRRVSRQAYHAMIFLPANYREFIKNWERLNPSPLGARHLEVDLHGTLIHEMLHVVLFYYNKNLNKDAHEPGQAQIDWYVEGLARYFETFAGARHDFFSQGFKVTLPDKIRFSRGGANYFMRYPDQSFMELRYENALFWRFLDYRYGMQAIEGLSRRLRDPSFENFQRSVKKITGWPIETLLKQYALCTLLKDFGLKEDSGYLMDVARTAVGAQGGLFHLADKVSGWATDYCEIRPEGAGGALPGEIGVAHRSGGKSLALQAVIFTRGGSQITLDAGPVGSGGTMWVSLREKLDEQHLGGKDVESVILLITNLDPRAAAAYEVLSRS